MAISHRMGCPPAAGFSYPAETTRHVATILGFPSKWSLPPKHYKNACQEIIQLALTISEFEPVRLYTSPDDVSMAEGMLNTSQRGQFDISIIPFATNHLWVRDTAPVYVYKRMDKRRYAIDFNFNEWGASLMNNEGASNAERWPIMDNRILEQNSTFAARIIRNDSALIGAKSNLCLEGGALVCDGDGTLIISESSVVGDDRNGRLSKTDIEDELKRELGVTKVIWFPGHKGLDLTDVHADAEVQFIKPGVLVLSKPHVSAPKQWFEVYEMLREVLSQESDAKGRQFEIHIIEEPSSTVTGNAPREDPATNYVNFYFVNGGVILPRFGDADADKKALDIMQKLCPDHVVKQVYVNALPLCGGVIHCATQPVY